VYWDNYIGYFIDGVEYKLKLSETGKQVYTLAEGLEDSNHKIKLFKRMDSCHMLTFHGFLIDGESEVLEPEAKPYRKIEVYGDSVSAGEVSEAMDYVGKSDPVHNGEYSNSWYSYAWMTARKLNAQLHNIAQGGIALLNQTGWFCAPDYVGLENTYDMVLYNPEFGQTKKWDFSNYTPHVVVIAIGQNDNHPEDYMKLDYDCQKAITWRSHYKAFVNRIRTHYPNALIILATTILEHDENWDRAIEDVCKEIEDEKIVHFLYSQNGKGTPGHIRISEAEAMSDELARFIESFGEEIWKD
jgi:hypothetical protein